MYILKFIKGSWGLTKYFLEAWFNGIGNCFTKKDVYWFACERYFDNKESRDKFREQFLNLADKQFQYD